MTDMATKPWLPDAVESYLNSAAEAHPDLIRLDTQRQYAGRDVYAATVSTGASSAKQALLFTQPHAHEPSTTVGLLHVLAELIYGADLSGNPTSLDRDFILERYEITFVPDGNPDGRDRAQCLQLDGTCIDDEQMRHQMRGTNPLTGQYWERYDRWSIDEVEPVPDPIGIVYEQLDEQSYCEPNRYAGSSFMRLCHRMLKQRPYRVWMDLHQQSMKERPGNAVILLPLIQNELTPSLQAQNRDLAERVHAAWAALPFGQPWPEPIPLGYTGEQARYFRSLWGPIQQQMVQLNVEVANNTASPTFSEQAQLEAEAVRTMLREWHLITQTERFSPNQSD